MLVQNELALIFRFLVSLPCCNIFSPVKGDDGPLLLAYFFFACKKFLLKSILFKRKHVQLVEFLFLIEYRQNKYAYDVVCFECFFFSCQYSLLYLFVLFCCCCFFFSFLAFIHLCLDWLVV